MRITHDMQIRNYLKRMNTNLKNLTDSNDRMTSQRAFTRPSENVMDASRALRIRKQLRDNEFFSDNMRDAQGRIGAAEDYLKSTVTMLKTVEERIVQALNGVYDKSDMQKMATEIGNLQEEVMQISNAQYSDNYIFNSSGSRGGNKPFTVDGGQLLYNGTPVDGLVRVDGRPMTNIDPVTGEQYYNEIKDADGNAVTEYVGRPNYPADARIVTDAAGNPEYTYIDADVYDRVEDPVTGGVSYEPRLDAAGDRVTVTTKAYKYDKEPTSFSPPEDLPAGSTAGVPVYTDDAGTAPAGSEIVGTPKFPAGSKPADPPATMYFKTNSYAEQPDGTYAKRMNPDGTEMEVYVEIPVYVDADGNSVQPESFIAPGEPAKSVQESPTYEPAYQEIPYNDKNFMNIGLGLKASGWGTQAKIDTQTVMEYSFSGVELFGYGVDEETGMPNNVYSLLGEIKTAMEDNDRDTLDKALTNLTNVRDTLLIGITNIGDRTNFLDDLQNLLDNDTLNLQTQQNKIEGIDLAEESMYNKDAERAWMVTLQLGSKIIPTSLFDFLR